MIPLQITVIVGTFLFTFGYALPWIISNNEIPLYLDILLFLMMLCFYIYWVNKLIIKLIRIYKRVNNKE